MDSLITAAARALAAGDLLGALKRVKRRQRLFLVCLGYDVVSVKDGSGLGAADAHRDALSLDKISH